MEKGLTNQEVQEKLKIYGKNEIIVKKEIPLIILFLSEFPTFINGILFFAAIFSFFVSDFLDGSFIVAILILNSFFGFIQKYKAEKSLEKLKNFVTPLARIIRNGKEVQIATSEIVPEDIVVISEGDRIPADGFLILGSHLEIDESILTGESIPVVKKQNEEIFCGTLVVKGRNQIRVARTGMKTRFGEIAKTLAELEADQTPLQKKLDSLGKTLSLIAVFFSLLLIPIGLYRGLEIFPLILLAISVSVAVIPESLPAVITIALSIGTNRMAKKNAIVRDMQAVETLGAIQILLTDKTGTLTQNSMRVKKVNLIDKKSLPDLLKACILGNTANLIEKDGEPISNWDIIGDKTDGALLSWAKAEKNYKKPEGEIIDEYVFDPVTKTVTIVWQQNGQQQVFVRGAVEMVLGKSKINPSEKEKVTKEFEEWAKQGLRVIGFGTKKIKTSNPRQRRGSPKAAKPRREELETDINFIGFIGIYDPPRKEVKEAIIKAKNAGIRTIMVTGDNEFTAVAIAREIGLIEKDDNVLTGSELSKITDEQLEKIILNTKVYARTKPEDKLRLVEIFKRLGLVVGVTGDGVNDALALKRADVGIAMGESGTDVAKEASDIILTDDNYSTLVKAIDEGRTIYSNILKSITYLLSGNLSELALIFFSMILGLPSPLLPTQILWINLITDGVPALALASDNKDPHALGKKPRNPKTPILTKNTLLFISFIALLVSLILLLVFKFLLENKNEVFARTFTFNLLIFLHMGIAFLVRGKQIFQRNRFLILGVLGIFIVQVFITIIPFFQKIFHLGF